MPTPGDPRVSSVNSRSEEKKIDRCLRRCEPKLCCIEEESTHAKSKLAGARYKV
jgi:hypothetical protein